MRGSIEIGGFLLLLSQGGHSCRPHWEGGWGHGYRWVSSAAVSENSSVILTLKGKYILSKRKGSSAAPNPMKLFHWQTIFGEAQMEFVISAAMQVTKLK